MIKNFLVSLALLFSIANFAQSGTASPYSYYGIGDVTFRGTVENRLMGGVSIFPDSTHVNLTNPASFATLKYTSFALGGNANGTKFKTNFGEDKAKRNTIDYLALGFPIGKKFGGGFGLMPYSSVGYNLETLTDDDNKYVTNRFSGTGGLNKAFIALGYNVNSKLSIGIDMHYNFGQISTNTSQYIPEAEILFGSRELDKSDMSGFTINTGLMYKTKFRKKFDAFASLVYTPKTTLHLSNERNIATIVYSQSAGEIVVDSEDIDVDDTELSLPSKVSIGAGFGQVRKWLIGTEITFSQAGYGSRFNPMPVAGEPIPTPAVNYYYTTAQKYSLGGYFIPNYNSYTSYFKKITYRAGLRYEKTGLVIADKAIDDMAISAGFGLPLKGTFSNINIGIELGKRGTKANGLIQENYSNISIGLSLNDLWFVKAKYD